MRRSRLIASAPRLAADRGRPEATRRATAARATRAHGSRNSRHALLRGLFIGFGQLHGPSSLFAGIDFEEPGAVEPARQAILGALDGEFLVTRTHEGLSRPFAAAVIVEGVDVIEARDKRSAQQRFATAGGYVPPAFGGPALGVLVAERNADPARRVVAEPKVGRRRTVPQPGERKRQHRQQAGDDARGKGGRWKRIFCSHAAKLYQTIDDFAWPGGACQRLGGAFPAMWEFDPIGRHFGRRYGKICDNSHLISIWWAINPAGSRP